MKRFTLRIAIDLFEKIARRALKHHRSVNNEIIHMLEEYIKIFEY